MTESMHPQKAKAARAAAKTASAPVPVPKLYTDEINAKEATAITGLSEMRFKALVREGKVPSAKKNAKGWWRFSKSAIEDWAANRPKRAFGASDGKKYYRARMTLEMAAKINEAIKGTGIELAPQPKYTPKSKAE